MFNFLATGSSRDALAVDVFFGMVLGFSLNLDSGITFIDPDLVTFLGAGDGDDFRDPTLLVDLTGRLPLGLLL